MTDHNQIQLFNSPLESGVRSLTLLYSIYPNTADLQQLVYFDYIVLHSGDFGGPESLHPPIPLRSGEILVRRELIEKGLNLLILRGLIEHKLDLDGIQYVASDIANPFLDAHSSPYMKLLRERALWVSQQYGTKTTEDLKNTVRKIFDVWTMEFQSIKVGV